ncbi:MAG TPA: acireductone synthase, partial [Acidobacteriaceae bacterium]|nr:acireductone synthase [Acidobacteriaceae bacterium]
MMSEHSGIVLPKLYLLDVEGTVSPVSLVYEQLFPYAKRHMEPYLRAHVREPWIDAGLADDLALLALENAAEADDGAPKLVVPEDEGSWETAVPEAAAYLHWLMERDRKSTALKALQGRVWRAGFEAGELVGTLFDDVPQAIARWNQHAPVAIYSSGSVEAQQLLFQHSSAGDLTPYLAGFFDTRIGAKTQADSYAAIAAAAHVDPSEVLFFSDVLRELDPAREAGCQTRLVLREGNAPVADY